MAGSDQEGLSKVTLSRGNERGLFGAEFGAFLRVQRRNSLRHKYPRQESNLQPSASEADERARCDTIKQGLFARSGKPLDHSLDRLDENASPKRAEGGGRKARKSKLKTAATTTAIPADDGNRRQPTTDFAQQVAGIMSLPLTDAERAECIRRLLAKQQKGC